MAKRELTEEQKQRMMAARQETLEEKKARRAITLNIGGWQVFRADEDNWILRKGEDGEPRYYPTQVSALKSLLHERIGEANSKSIAAVLTAVQKAEAEIARLAS